MKYMVVSLESLETQHSNVTITADGENFTSFPAVVGNPNYDAFLEQTDLTDIEVHELKPDIWYDFPEGE